jgi:hypothetical protein
MDEEFRFYQLSHYYLIFPFVFTLGWLLIGYDSYVFQDRDIDVLIVWILLSAMHFVFWIYPYQNPLLSTTSDKIIIGQYLSKPIVIEIKNIITIERKSIYNLKIFYRNDVNIVKKQTLKLYFLKLDDKLSFQNYIQSIIDKIDITEDIKRKYIEIPEIMSH